MGEAKEIASDIMIIGAGIAGLMAAKVLQDKGYRVIVTDKSKGVGGRLATRRVGPGLADHGAQFFTVRTDDFMTYVDQWMRDGLVYVWSNGFSDGSLTEPASGGHPRYVTKGGMNALAKHISQEIDDIYLERRIVSATFDQDGWIFQDQNGNIFTSQALLMTPPVPQSLEILDAGATRLDDGDYSSLAAITYAECLTGLFWVEGRVTLPRPGAVQRRNTNIMWIGDNQQKGISPDARLITVQAGEQYSRQIWNSSDERILNSLRTHLLVYMDESAKIREAQLKRWRYSRPLLTYPERCMVANLDRPLVFAGDAFGGPRVEGAVLSGLAAGDKVAELLTG